MTDLELISLVKKNLKLQDDSIDLCISDMINEVKNYCNLNELTKNLEPFIRKKVKAIMIYEEQNGETVFDVKSVSIGDTSYSFNVEDNNSRLSIYGLSEADKKMLRQFRRLR